MNQVQNAPRPKSKHNGVSWDENRKAWQVQFWDGEMKKRVQVGRFREEAHAAVAHDLVALHLKALHKLGQPYRPTPFLQKL